MPIIRRFPAYSAWSACFDLTYKTRIPSFLLLPFYFITLSSPSSPSPSFTKTPNYCGDRESMTALHPSLALCSRCLWFRCIHLPPRSLLFAVPSMTHCPHGAAVSSAGHFILEELLCLDSQACLPFPWTVSLPLENPCIISSLCCLRGIAGLVG
ncbi:hypothetical protein P152DRAFT_459826 [Eremomyces bilateralis CBS 781.70]|uniref:Uncharacterized protein n=1 Tax=Eremomyces bilateralis CBS 781.70 TaxID=1392243 RepID=A0A6G1FZ30_9PEZI|nr:uncharacterized protein P152DRAFT_459826 [Eremomyces bilateralis CBS 781.70]KAF1810951.1 hypothetical protein P152DRAFT_459826 [Eremomyces bilateralis CBS 781.70]